MDQNIEIGDWVRAYDFEPHPGRRDVYVIGEVVEFTDNDRIKVKVYKDTHYGNKMRPFIFTPKQGYVMFEWDGRITKLG